MTLRCNRLSGIYANNPAPVAPLTRQPPTLVSPFACAYDLTEGRVLYDRRANEVYDYPASTVKVMTMLLVAERKASQLTETVTWQTSDDLDPSFSQVGFINGDVVSWAALLHSMMMVSGGDACQAAARVIGNETLGQAPTSTAGYARFVTLMNRRAQQLGCFNTRFTNSHGAESHYTTARDMAIISGACFSNPVIAAMALATSYNINVAGENARTIAINNGNPLLGQTGVRGSKTGSLSGGIYPTTFSLNTLWRSTGGNDIAITTMFSPTSAGRYDDFNAIITALPTDFPYITT